VGRVGGLTILLDTGDQVVCTVGRRMATATPTIPQGEQVEWNSLLPHATLLMSPRVCNGPVWLDSVDKKPPVKADLLIYSNCITVSGQYWSVAIIISNKIMYFNFCACMVGFPKSSHIYNP